MKEAAPKVNKKSMQILRQKEERLEAQRLKEAMERQRLERDGQLDEQQSLTARDRHRGGSTNSRLKQPTNVNAN